MRLPGSIHGSTAASSLSSAAWTRSRQGVVSRTRTGPADQRATVPPGATTEAARTQKSGIANQCAAVAAVRRSTVWGGTGGERSVPSREEEETPKRREGDGEGEEERM